MLLSTCPTARTHITPVAASSRTTLAPLRVQLVLRRRCDEHARIYHDVPVCERRHTVPFTIEVPRLAK